MVYSREYPSEAMSRAASDVQRGPNLSHIIPAGNPRDIPKFDIDPKISTEMLFLYLYYQEKSFFDKTEKNVRFLLPEGCTSEYLVTGCN